MRRGLEEPRRSEPQQGSPSKEGGGVSSRKRRRVAGDLVQGHSSHPLCGIGDAVRNLSDEPLLR